MVVNLTKNQKKTEANQFGEFTGMEGFPTYHSKEDAVKAAVKAVLSYEGDIRHNGLKTDGFAIIRQGVTTFIVEFIRKTTEGEYRCFAVTYRKTIEKQLLPDGTNLKTEVFRLVRFCEY